MFLTPLRKLIVPCSLILASILLRQYVPELPAVYLQLVILLPYLSLGLALILCVFFHLSRLFAASLVILCAYFLIQTHLQTSLQDDLSLLLYASISFVIPTTILMLQLLPERGLNNLYGFMVVSIIPLQVAAMLLIYLLVPVETLVNFIRQDLPLHPFDSYMMSLAISACYLLVWIVGLV